MDIASMSPEEAEEFLEVYHIDSFALDRVIKSSYKLLSLISFFTVLNEEVRAWTVPARSPALEAADTVHSDMKRGFIRAEVLSFEDLKTHGSFQEAKQKGLVRLEGKDYPWGDQAPICNPDTSNGAQFTSCDGRTAPVGTFAPNGYGLYDMAGNVSEWVWDWYQENYYAGSPAENPTGPESGSSRVKRGGSFGDVVKYIHTASHFGVNPRGTSDGGGFRCARSP